MRNERFWLDIESGIIFDNENEKDFDPVKKLNEQDQQIADLEKQLVKKDKEISELEKENEVLRKALELACEKLPMSAEYCCNRPERYNLQDEYGSDEPYWVVEGGCEFDSDENCLNCVVNYFIQQAKESMNEQV